MEHIVADAACFRVGNIIEEYCIAFLKGEYIDAVAFIKLYILDIRQCLLHSAICRTCLELVRNNCGIGITG